MASNGLSQAIRGAAAAISAADAIIMTAGAGFGVCSGLPDFRGNEGFWSAYPPMKRLGLSFIDCANPAWFESDPEFAWGFYGHRLGLYRSTNPHKGFYLLRKWMNACAHGGYVFTSNVDGQFQKAGIDRVVECHGSIHHVQCTQRGWHRFGNHRCGAVLSADNVHVAVDPDFKADMATVPRCPACHSISRPNILMFNDFGWVDIRTCAQTEHFREWLATLTAQKARVVVVEAGAGYAVPTVRMASEAHTRYFHRRSSGGTLVRINPTDADISSDIECGFSIPLRSADAIERIDALL